jgi:hypothetical protein
MASWCHFMVRTLLRPFENARLYRAVGHIEAAVLNGSRCLPTD